MKNIWIKSGLLGFAIYALTFAISAFIVGFTAPLIVTDVDLIAKVLKTCVLVWFVLAAALIVPFWRINKITTHAILARTLFIWVPMSAGWFLTISTGVTRWFALGMLISSFFLAYEILVLRKRKAEVKT